MPNGESNIKIARGGLEIKKIKMDSKVLIGSEIIIKNKRKAYTEIPKIKRKISAFISHKKANIKPNTNTAMLKSIFCRKIRFYSFVIEINKLLKNKKKNYLEFCFFLIT